jgi:hypothetical protein
MAPADGHAAIIDLWPRLADFAADIGVDPNTAKAMRRRGSIPPGHWTAACAGAERRGIPGVTEKVLAERVAKRSAEAAGAAA